MSEWKFSLFQCFDTPLACCWTACVPCGIPCMQGTTAYKSTGDGCSCFVACIYSIIFCCIGTAYNRSKIRDYRIIRGSYMSDLCTVCYCPCCAMVQEWRETMLAANLDQDQFIFKALASSNKC